MQRIPSWEGIPQGTDPPTTMNPFLSTGTRADLDPPPLPPPTMPLDHVRAWAWETLACAIAVIMVMAVVVTIYTHADHPLPQWPYGITINGLLSIYSIVLRACIAYAIASCISQLQWTWFSANARPLYDAILYDNAGRGPWGSFVWIWNHHIRQPLTTIGAILMLVSLAIDPVIQQLVVPVDCVWPVPEINVTLPRTSYLGLVSTPSLITPAQNMQLGNAVTRGISSSGSDIIAQCPTGNCTFADTFGTLGYCSSCEDITEQLSLTYQCCHFNSTNYNCTEISDPANCTGTTGNFQINFVTTLHSDTQNGPKVFEINAPQLIYSPGGRETHWTFEQTSFNLGLMVWKGDNSVWGIATMLFVLSNTLLSGTGLNPVTGEQLPGCEAAAAGQNNWGCRGYGAVNCTISPCVRLYNASVVDTQLSEILVETVGLPPIYEDPVKQFAEFYGLIDTQCVNSADISRLKAQNITILGSEPQLTHGRAELIQLHHHLHRRLVESGQAVSK